MALIVIFFINFTQKGKNVIVIDERPIIVILINPSVD